MVYISLFLRSLHSFARGRDRWILWNKTQNTLVFPPILKLLPFLDHQVEWLMWNVIMTRASYSIYAGRPIKWPFCFFSVSVSLICFFNHPRPRIGKKVLPNATCKKSKLYSCSSSSELRSLIFSCLLYNATDSKLITRWHLEEDPWGLKPHVAPNTRELCVWMLRAGSVKNTWYLSYWHWTFL